MSWVDQKENQVLCPGGLPSLALPPLLRGPPWLCPLLSSFQLVITHVHLSVCHLPDFSAASSTRAGSTPAALWMAGGSAQSPAHRVPETYTGREERTKDPCGPRAQCFTLSSELQAAKAEEYLSKGPS